ncbi:Zinc finger, RING-type [Corchorus capsularis]|uniref:RING-type E3 ubiquitin transferase n=1 Tax=Corchorus capsularis TaxID=210143 RepID=A0A1R3GLN5_COCAP|nr:Zinc finger, RING-type [Corchorus capsularis]
MGWCRHGRDSQGQTASSQPQSQHPPRHGGRMLELESLENSMAQLIPAHKYHKGMGLLDEDGICPVCLSQFEEGEELRTLPECLHSYHAPCIDMWLYSHSSCPMCRSDATPSPSPQINPVHQPDSMPAHQDSGMLHNIVQSRTM